MTLRRPTLLDRAVALLLTWAMPGSSAWALTPLSAAAFANATEAREAVSRVDAETEANFEAAPEANVIGETLGSEADAAPIAPMEFNLASPEPAEPATLSPTLAIPQSTDCTRTVFPAERFTRTTGPATMYDRTFTVPAWIVSPYGLTVYNGEANGSNRISSAEVFVNNVRVLQQSDFNQNVYTLERSVTLTAGLNTLRVRLTSKPGSYLTLGGCGTNGDTVTPTIIVPSPVSGSFTNDVTPLVIARYSDALSGIDTASFRARIDNVDRTALFATRSDEASADAPPLLEGSHTVVAEVRDVAGNLSTASTTFTVDVTPPALAFAAPADGAALPQPAVAVTLNLSDGLSGIDVSTLKILVNGADRTALFSPGAGQATATLGPAHLQDGANQVTATVRDLASNESTTAVSFAIDTTPPRLVVGQPVDGARLGSSTTPVIVQFSDDQQLDLATLTATLDGAAFAMSVASDSATAVSPALAEGAHTFVASIADRAGNTTTRQAAFTVDTQVPSIVIEQPAPSFLLPTSTPYVALSYSDAQGVDVATVRVWVDGADRTAEFAVGPDTAHATLAPIPEGAHTITAEIRDLTGNLGTTSAPFSTDTVAPVVAISSPASGARLRSNLPELRFGYQDPGGSGVEPDTIRAFLDGIDVTPVFVRGGVEAVGVPAAPLTDGNHTLRVEVGDRAYNVGAAESTFLVDTLAPTATFQTPTDNSFTNDETPDLRVSFADLGRDVLGTAAPASGIDLASVRVFLRSGDPEAPEFDLTPGLIIDASTITGVIPGPLPASTHRLRVEVQDRAGNRFEASAAFEVDVTPPTFQIVSIAPGAGVPAKTPTFEIRYSDDRSGVAADLFVLKVDGVDRTARLSVGPSEATGTLLPADALPDGPHVYEFTLFDRALNRTDSGALAFFVDTVAPTATLAEPPPGSFSGVNTPRVRFEFQDAAPSAGIDPGSTLIQVDGTDRTAEFTITPDGALIAALTPTLADGSHTVRADIVDFAGNPGSVVARITVDTEAPLLTSDIPEEGRLIGGGSLTPDGRATLTGTATDLDPNLTAACSSGAGVGVATMAQGQAGALSNGAYSCLVLVTEGLNEISVTVTDSTGHAATITRNLTVDRIAPVISISTPSEGTVTSALSLSVDGLVTDASPVTVTVNGLSATVTSGSGGGPSTYEAHDVAVGALPVATFEAVATDAAGNTATAAVTVRVDRNPPVVVIVAPAEGAYLRGGVTTVAVDVTDESATVLDINGVPGMNTGCVAAGEGLERCSYTADIPLLAGNTTIVATAFDEAANRGVAQVATIVDNMPPAITVALPLAGFVTNATSLSLTGTVLDSSPVTLTVDGEAVSTAADGSFSATIPAGLEGPRSVVLVATDAAGNQSTATVSGIIDRTPPALTIASPLQGAIVPMSSVSVSGTVTDATAVVVTVQGSAASVTGLGYSTSLSGLNEGPLTITVRAVDAAGNASEATRDVEIDLGPPTVAITSPEPGALTRESTAILAYTVLDRSLTTIRVNDVAVSPDCPGILPCHRSQTVNLADGDNTFVVEATDAGGRTTIAQVTITRDSAPPVLDLQTPETVSRSRPATASASATDNLAMAQVEIRQGSTVPQGEAGALICTGVASCSGPIPVPETARAGDSLSVTAIATDTAGNVTTTSRSVRVTADGVVTGTVLDDRTSLPLAGATVTLLGENSRTTTTDANGRYNIPVSDISAMLRFEKAAFLTVDRVVSVASGVGTVPTDARLSALAAVASATPVVIGPVSVALPDGDHQITLLSAQGLPNLLALGFSPLIALNWTSAAPPSGPAQATITLPSSAPESLLVRYDPGMRDWRIMASALVPTGGVLTVDLAATGSYALVVPDPTTPPIAIGAIGEALTGLGITPIPATATSESRVDPAILPPTGGTATGSMRLDSPTSLPSGTVVQADVEETYTLASGEEASAPKRSMDVLVFRSAPPSPWGTTCAPSTPALPGVETFHLCAAFPITPSRTYATSALREGRVHLDLLAGRENARGVVGGNEAITVTSGQVRLNVAAGSSVEDTAISLLAYDTFSTFVPTENGITPLGEVTVDYSAATLNTSASLTFLNVAAAPGDTLVVARVDRAAYDGIPRLQVVALAELQGTDAVSVADTGLPGVTLEGIKKEGRYVLLQLAGPIGFIAGTTYVVTPAQAGAQTQSPVRALVTTNTLPFVATSTSGGYYAIPAVAQGQAGALPGPVTVNARVLGQSLAGTVNTAATAGTPTTADIALEGTVSQATITPVSGAIGVEVNEPLTLTSPVALDPATVTAANITLRTVPQGQAGALPENAGDPSIPVTLRLVLSGSGKQLSIIPTAPVTTPPTPALSFSTNYILEIAGLLDTVGGVVTAPTTSFRTKDDIKPVYNLKALTFSFPDADGLVTVSAPNDTFPPGTEILIINSGNGVVLGLTAGNDGEVNGTFPASTLDTLIVSVTDPFGNSVIYKQSQFTNPLTGETAIGPGGGSIDGPGGAGLDIPEGALNDGGGEWKVKLSLVPESEYPTLYPRDVLTTLLGADLHAGPTVKMESNRPATFSREVDVRFPLPDFTKAPVDQRPPSPQDAFYTVHRKMLVCPDGGAACAEEDKIVIFEVIDEARVQCKAVPSSTGPSETPATCVPEALEIVTASPPFGGFGASLGLDILFLSWAYDVLLPARPTRGLVRGTVRRQAYEDGKLVSVPVAGALVSGVDAGGTPLIQTEGGTAATTTGTGTYALWDERYVGGPIEVVATADGTTVRGQGLEVLPGEPSYPRYKQEAVVNLTFPTEAPPPAVPAIGVTLLRASDGVNLKGIAPVGVPLQIGIKGSIPGQAVTINGVDINGVPYSVRTDPDARYDYILDTPFSPSTPGTYRLTGTALRPIGDPVAFGDTFRIVAAGGGVDTDNANAPAVIDARTTPKKNAKGVSVSSFVSLSLTEPVKNVLGNIEFTAPGEAVDYRISAVTPDGTVISDLSTAPTAAVTSITIEPLYGLKFGTTYTVRALSGIQDLDQDATSQPAPKSLTPYETSFETFGPETINPDSQDAYSTGGFVILKTEESITGWALKHQFGGATWNGILLGYDASDPANLTQISETFVQNRVIDITGEGTTVVVASGTNHRSHPGALLVYDVTNPQAPAWVGAGTVSSGALDGTPSRIKMKGEKLYAATWRKGIQVVDINQLKAGFAPCCSGAYFNMVRDLSLDGGSFNSGAVISTIDVIDPVSPSVKPWMRDISVIDVNGESIIAVASSIGLVLANEAQVSVVYRGQPSHGGRTMAYAYAVETALIGSRPVVLVAGIGAAGQNILIVVDISIPGNPTPIGSMTLATQGKAIADIEIEGDKAYIGFDSPNAPQIEIVQIGDPANPASVGVLTGVGGRLQVVEGVLYGASYGYATEGVLGGIRTAALATLALIDGTNPGIVVIGEGPTAAEDFKLKYRVVPSSTEVQEAHIDYVVSTTTVGNPVTVTLGPGGRGETPLQQGFQFPKIGTTIARPRLSLTTADGIEVVGPARFLKLEQPTVELVFEDEQEEGVTADQPEVGVRVTSAEWYRRFAEAQDKGEQPPASREVMFASVSPAGLVSPDQVASRDGIFETSLANLTVPAPSHQVRAFVGPVTIGISDPTEVLPGPAQTIALTPSRSELPLDGASETLITLTARDNRGNLVLDGTGVFWETDGDGEFVEPREATSNGIATVKYRAGETKTGPVTITASIDDVEQTLTIQQHPIHVTVSLDRTEAFLDTLALQVTATATTLGGTISPNAEVSFVASSGRITVVEPLSNGQVRALWEPAGTQYRYSLTFQAAVAEARGQSPTIPWRALLSPQSSGAADAAAFAEMSGSSPEPAPMQTGTENVPRVASAFPAVIAGDRTSDGTYALELPDGTTRDLPYTTQSVYRITGLIPDESVSISLGSNGRPNVATIAHYSGTQGIVNGQIPDDLGGTDGDATGGVSADFAGYLGAGYRLDGAGTITIPHGPSFAFSAGFMLQAAIRPPPGSNGVIFEKAGQFRVDLVGGYPRFTVRTGAAIGPAGEVSVTSAQSVAAGQWTLLGARFDGTTIKVTVDDYEETVVMSSSVNAALAPIVIGAGFDGLIDEIKIFDLSAGPLLTFPGGATEIQGVADPSGNFETVIRSAGSLVARAFPVAGDVALAFADGEVTLGALYSGGFPSFTRFLVAPGEFSTLLQDPAPTATQEALSQNIVDVNAYFEASAQRATTPLGVATSDMLARAFLVIGGIWGAGPPDDPYVMAGDLVLGTIAQAITTPRDLINAFDHARRGQGDKFEILTIAMAAAGAAAVVFSKKARILGKFRQLPKLLTAFGPAAEANRVLGKRLLKGIKEIVADAPGAKTLENIAEAAETLSTQGRQALANVLNTAGDQGRMLDKVETIVKNAPDKEGVIKAMGEAQQVLPQKKFKAMLSIAGACAIGAAAADGPISSCPIPDAAAVAAWSSALTGGASPAYLAKIALREVPNLDTPKDVVIRLGKAYAAQAENTTKLVSDLAHPSFAKAFGGQAVLKVGIDILESVPASQRLGLALNFEQRVEIGALLTAKGNIRSRLYDVVYKAVDGLRRIEVKRWTSFPPSGKALRDALDQFDRDFVAHFTVQGFSLSQLRWKFPDLAPAHRAALTKVFLDRIKDSEVVKRVLGTEAFKDALEDLGRAAPTLFELR